MLGWLVEERGIEPHIPVFDKSGRSDGTLERADFAYDRRADAYVCPAGKTLRQFHRPADSYRTPRSGVDAEGMMRYRASKRDCDACPLKPRCCPGQPQRKIMRSIHEGARDMAREIAKSDEYVVSRRCGRRSRCSSPTSSASCASVGFACAAPAAPATSSTSPPQPRTSGSSQS